MQVYDDSAEATLGLWGALSHSPSGSFPAGVVQTDDGAASNKSSPWKPGETVLLLQSPGWKLSRTTYLNFTSSTIVDIDPAMKDAEWLRRWASRQKSKDALNPPFPEGVFDLDIVLNGTLRCLYTIGELDDFSRAAPEETFQGYLSVLVKEMKLLENWKRNMLMCGECCSMPVYANAVTAPCKGCDQPVDLRLNPRIVGF